MPRNTGATRTQGRKSTGTQDVIQPGRRALPWTQIHDWIIYSSASPEAKTVYSFLRSHVNEKRGDQLSWPGTEAIALLLGLPRGDKAAPFIRELRDLGAIDVSRQRWGDNVRNVYTVHDTPPPGYTGPVSQQDWLLFHGPEIVRRKEARAQHSRDQRAKQRTARGKSPTREYQTVRGLQRPASVPLSADVTVVDPVSGVRVHLTPGVRVHPDAGVPVHPDTGQELPGVELPESQQHEPTPPPPSPAAASTAQNGCDAPAPPEGEEAETPVEEDPPGSESPEDLVSLLRRHAPHWSRRKILSALGDPQLREHPPLVVRTALLALAQGEHVYGRTVSPRRVLEDGDWWADAYEAVTAAEAPPRPAPIPVPRRTACTTTDCQQGLVDVPGVDVPLACPCCRPTAHAEQVMRASGHAPGVTDYPSLLAWTTSRVPSSARWGN